MMTQDPVISKITDGLYIGNSAAAKNCDLLNQFGITAVFNFGSLYKRDQHYPAMVFDYVLPSQELMDSEIPKTMLKLDSIAEDIHATLAESHRILVVCSDGKNKSTLAVGYYLIKKASRNLDVVVETLESAYCNSSMDDAALRTSRALTMASFRKVLRLASKP
jgi:hypothetical protein